MKGGGWGRGIARLGGLWTGGWRGRGIARLGGLWTGGGWGRGIARLGGLWTGGGRGGVLLGWEGCGRVEGGGVKYISNRTLELTMRVSIIYIYV